MRKILSMAIAITILATSAAHADYRGPRPGYGGGGGNWVAPLVGGLIVGGIVGGAMAQPRYYEEPGWHTECRRERLFDQWGNFIGYERHCYRVPNN